jgi:hypothetical protein
MSAERIHADDTTVPVLSPERRAERRITIFDGIFGIAQQMRQADLPLAPA